MRSAVIVDAVRTASGKGKPGGALSGAHPVELLAAVLSALIDRTGLDPERVDDVIAGCVAQVGEQSLNIGRQGVLAAGWPVSVPATSIDRQCGSSQQAAHFGAQGVIAGAYDIVVEDEGPGIPEEDRQRVFEPFVRLESSRNEETGGSGLGLTLVKAIAEGHGGTVTLENRPEGGLRVRMRLPHGRTNA